MILQVFVLSEVVSLIRSFPLFPLNDVVDGYYDGHTNVKVRINNVVSELSTLQDIIYLRTTLKELYPLTLNNGQLELNLGGTNISLMHSTLIIPTNFQATAMGRDGIVKSTSQRRSSHFANLPFCLLHATEDSLTGYSTCVMASMVITKMIKFATLSDLS